MNPCIMPIYNMFGPVFIKPLHIANRYKIKNSLFTICFLLTGLTHISAQSQSVKFEWAKQMGGTDADYDAEQSIAVDDSGNVYTVGSFLEIADFDPSTGIANLTSYGGTDVFVSKLDASGNFVWAKQMGGTEKLGDLGASITLDASGNVYTTGYFRGTADFDPGIGTYTLTSEGVEDIFISKLDVAGNFVWAKQMGGRIFDAGTSIALDSSGNVYTTGYFSEVVDFDPSTGIASLTSYGGTDVFVSKLDASGNFIWAKQMGGQNSDRAKSIAVDISGYIYTVGSFDGTADFDPSTGMANLTSYGGTDIFVSKLDTSGNFVWVKQIGGISYEIIKSMATDVLGNVYTIGDFYGTVDFDPGINTYTLSPSGGYAGYRVFISKLDSSGNFRWVKQISGRTSAYSITVEPSGNVYATGSFSETADFDDGFGVFNLTSYGETDGFIIKLDASGNFVWAKQIGGGDSDEGESIAIDTSGNIYISGDFTETADFDPGMGIFNLSSKGSRDIFVSKFVPCTGTTGPTFTISACNSYSLSPQNYTLSGFYTQILTDATGCDSTITFNLTINSVDNAVTQGDSTLTADETDASYQWLDCMNSYSPIIGATGKSYTPIANGTYAVIVTKNGCTDTSACYNVNVVGIESAFENSLMVYPNPANEEITLSANRPLKNALIKLIYMNGQIAIEKIQSGGKSFTFDISELPDGFYIIEIKESRSISRIKLIKN